MDNVVKQIRKWERIESRINIGLIASIVWCIVMVIILDAI